ncbi:unnamed protein product [Rotaria sp. Silwood1]|nr:unnamed protein product [Rotaria sp. Silwood1]
MQLLIILFISYFINCSILVRAIDIGDNSPFWNNINILSQNHNDLWTMINGLQQKVSGLEQTINEQQQKLNHQEQMFVDLKKNISDQQQKIIVQQETIQKLPTFCQGRTSYDQWQPYADHRSLLVHVNTTSCRFKQVPTYFTSLSGTSHHWRVTGMTSIYNEVSTGFIVCLYPEFQETQTETLQHLPARKWELNWIGIVQ